MVIYIQVVDTVEPVEQGRQRVDHVERTVVLRQREDPAVTVCPSIRNLFARVLADRHRVAEMICGIHIQVHRHHVFAMFAVRVGIYGLSD